MIFCPHFSAYINRVGVLCWQEQFILLPLIKYTQKIYLCLYSALLVRLQQSIWWYARCNVQDISIYHRLCEVWKCTTSFETFQVIWFFKRLTKDFKMVGSATQENGKTSPSLPEIRICDDVHGATSLPLCYEEHNSSGDKNVIKLPMRYERHLKKNRLFSSLLGSNPTIVEESDCVIEVNSADISNDEKSREHDLMTAIQWIRQEVVSGNMKNTLKKNE